MTFMIRVAGLMDGCFLFFENFLLFFKCPPRILDSSREGLKEHPINNSKISGINNKLYMYPKQLFDRPDSNN